MARNALDAGSGYALDTDDGFMPPAEKPAARRRRLSAKAKGGAKAQEVSRAGSVGRLERAAKKLKRAPASERILRVPQWDMDMAAQAMRKAGVSGVVTNLCGSRRVRVDARR